MGRARNKRAKDESTFLEQVKGALESVLAEVKQVNISVEEVKLFVKQEREQPLFHMGIPPSWEQTWDPAFPFWHTDGNTIDQQTWNLLAKEFKPIDQANLFTKGPLSKEFLLTYRHSQTLDESLNLGFGSEDRINIMEKTADTLQNSCGFEACSKCQLPVADCICWNVYCRQCMKIGSDCVCAEPQVQRKMCSRCYSPQDVNSSLFDVGFLSPPPPTCETCGTNDLVKCVPPAYYNIDSATACGVCDRVDAQEALLHCCSLECERLLHRECSFQAPRPQLCDHNREFVLCPMCMSNGLEVVCDVCLVAGEHSNIPTRYREGTLENRLPQSPDEEINASLDVPECAKSQILREAETRESALTTFEKSLGGLMDIIDEADRGAIRIPRVVRDLGLTAAKTSYEWFRQDPSKASVSELMERANCMNGLIEKIRKSSS